MNLFRKKNELLEQKLKAHAPYFSPLVPFNSSTERILHLDLSIHNKSLVPEIFTDTSNFSAWIDAQLQQGNARYGIGGYGEHRAIYSRSEVFDSGEEPRRLHLGLDIWGAALTPVCAPMDGIVHSVANNDAKGDYGATIVLTHLLGGLSFHTLYGHLSLADINGLQPGKRVIAGETFASFGIPAENGQWPPHLHFQVIRDLQGREGDYPGVCKYSERDHWLANGANPALMLTGIPYQITGSE